MVSKLSWWGKPLEEYHWTTLMIITIYLGNIQERSHSFLAKVDHNLIELMASIGHNLFNIDISRCCNLPFEDFRIKLPLNTVGYIGHGGLGCKLMECSFNIILNEWHLKWFYQENAIEPRRWWVITGSSIGSASSCIKPSPEPEIYVAIWHQQATAT